MRLFRKNQSSQTEFAAPIAPEAPFYAVGDLHGCDALFERLLIQLEKDAHPSARFICVGDYVDRGDDSARLLQRLHLLEKSAGGMMVCLMGNHERMLLDFLDDPPARGFRWQRNGGLQTLASYGLRGVPETGSETEWVTLSQKLRAKMGEDLVDWLRDLPLHWQSGNVAVTHAGADPELPIKAQGEKELLWGRSGFFNKVRSDGTWVAYGHIITRKPKAEQGRIPLDTGAYATGQLTAALIEPGSVRYIMTS
ncbi:metallophosphoesterase [Pacificoceanicola onchidii]|uniref:metallophosphoesterase n=1 Tax=Pacificoceanicola onchidii TaxID=2562685 RepID=UPI0010A5E6B4|nr:metallophosphoesterase [Pacificoceanicola onchidii]